MQSGLSRRMASVHAAVFALLLLVGWSAQASPLGLYDPSDPRGHDQWWLDISTGADSQLLYDAASGELSVSGIALQLKNEGVVHTILDGVLTISATIDSAGVLAPGGALTINGTVPTLGFVSGILPLLTGDLTTFGPGGAGDPFEFLFDVTGGEAAPLYGGAGSGVGGIVIFDTGYAGDFTASFGSSTAEVHVIPEPSSALLAGLGLLCVRGALRRRRAGLRPRFP